MNMLRHIHKKYPSDYSVCIFDAKGKNFRIEIFKEYKANRDATPEGIKLAVPYIKA